MWRQLQRVAIPVFSGDKRNYENWKAAFLACIDRATVTPELQAAAVEAISIWLQRTGWRENLMARGGKLQFTWKTWTISNQ